MKKTLSYFLISIVFLGISSCEVLLFQPQPESDPKSIFDQVWNFANERYSFFEFKKIDWDASKTKYGARITDSMGEEELFKVCGDMLGDLKDGHVNLQSKFNVSRSPEVFLEYPTNYFGEILNRGYFKGQTQILDGSFRLYDFGDILYVNYSDFTLPVTEYAMDYISDKMQGKRGMILDVRENGGGSTANIDLIVNRLIDKKISTGVEWFKSGPGREDFKKDSVYISPSDSKKKILDKPIALLVNRGCYSATNMFVMAMTGLPNVTTIGGRTGGGGGYPSTTQLSNGWTLRVSSSRLFDKKGFNVENGIEPKIKKEIKTVDFANLKDPILDEGLRFLRASSTAIQAKSDL
ncbi:MAG: S41 family peptidase [Leadbetterella sp.]